MNRRKSVIYLIISLLGTGLLACRTGDFVAMMVGTTTPTATRTARATFTLKSTSAPTPTSTIVTAIIPTVILKPSPTIRPTPRPSPKPTVVITLIAPVKTVSPWPFSLRQRTEMEALGKFQIRVRVEDGNGVPVNGYQIKLTGTGLESPTIRYTGVGGEPDGEVVFTPMGNDCPEAENREYSVTIFSEDGTGNKQLSDQQEIKFTGCSGGRGKIFLLFSK